MTAYTSKPIAWEGTEYLPRLCDPLALDLPAACPLAGEARTIARGWAANFGLSPSTSRASDLRAIWNATTVEDAHLVVRAAAAADETPAPEPVTPEPTPAPVTPAPTGKRSSREEALALLLADGMTEERVIQLVRDHAPKPDGALRIEVKTDREPMPIVTGLVHKDFPRVLDMVAAGLNICLIGPAGTGKSSMIRAAAKAVGKPLSSTCALQSVHELLGFVTATGEYVNTPFRKAYEEGEFFLFDEFDSSDQRALMKFNQALDGSPTYAFPNGMVAKHDRYQAGMTANVWNGATGEYCGRSKIDAAMTNRLARFFIGYDENLEKASFPNEPRIQRFIERCHAIRKAVTELGVKHLVTIRNMQRGAEMISRGWDIDECLTVFVRENLDNDQWSKIKTAARI